MKVRVTITVEVDPEIWTLEYGVNSTAEIRDDVKTYVVVAVRDSAASEVGAFEVLS